MSVRRVHTVHANLSLIFKVALVGDDNHWERVLVLDSENTLMERGDFLERVARCNGVDEEETLA